MKIVHFGFVVRCLEIVIFPLLRGGSYALLGIAAVDWVSQGSECGLKIANDMVGSAGEDFPDLFFGREEFEIVSALGFRLVVAASPVLSRAQVKDDVALFDFAPELFVTLAVWFSV